MIYLIRHGKTAANEKQLYCGSTDLPLSAAGREELQGLRYDIKNAHFITSGMKRAEETLQILFGDVPYVQNPAFREVDFGVFEMRSYQELRNDPLYQAWILGDNEVNTPPGGESGKQMAKRVVEAFFQVEDNTVIITHGGVIAAIMAHLFPDEGKNRYDWQPKPGYGYEISGRTYKTIL